MKYLQSADAKVVVAPQASATTARAGNLDCQGADYATFLVSVTAEANTNSTGVVLSVLESDDTETTNFATFSTNHAVTIDNTAAVVHKACVDMKGRKRYLRVVATPDTTTNGAVLCSISALLNKEVKAASDSESVS